MTKFSKLSYCPKCLGPQMVHFTVERQTKHFETAKATCSECGTEARTQRHKRFKYDTTYAPYLDWKLPVFKPARVVKLEQRRMSRKNKTK